MFARIKKRKSLIIGCIVVLLLAAAAVTPWVWWHLQPSRTIDVLIVDKSVAKPQYREHAGLTWLLRHEKVRDRSTGDYLDVETSYAGRQHPGPTPKDVAIPKRPLDLVYLADTYGVYEDDLKGRSLGLRSPLIYGGISIDEASRITSNVRPGGVLVGEFNSLATPTTGAARRHLEDAFGIRWTGWVGRHFQYLDLTVDLPLWIPRTWRRQTGRRWEFRGPGYVFVDERGTLVVLIEGVDTPVGAVRIAMTPAAVERYGTTRSEIWDNWFDIVEPLPGTEVLATYSVALTEAGKKKARGVPITGAIPAIMRRDTPQRLSYYFAGDFVDMPLELTRYKYKWMPTIRRFLAPEHRDDQVAFYWRVYVPLMQRIIGEASDRAQRGT